MDDLKGDTEVDPLNIFDRFYLRNNKQLEVLDDVIDTAPNAKKAAEEFLQKAEKFDLKPAIQKEDNIKFRESLDDEAVEMEETKDLGDRLKDADDDPDMPEMAEGGRIGFKTGTIMSPQMQDFIENYADQMTFEQYLQMTVKRKNKAGGGLSYLMGM